MRKKSNEAEKELLQILLKAAHFGRETGGLTEGEITGLMNRLAPILTQEINRAVEEERRAMTDGLDLLATSHPEYERVFQMVYRVLIPSSTREKGDSE